MLDPDHALTPCLHSSFDYRADGNYARCVYWFECTDFNLIEQGLKRSAPSRFKAHAKANNNAKHHGNRNVTDQFDNHPHANARRPTTIAPPATTTSS